MSALRDATPPWDGARAASVPGPGRIASAVERIAERVAAARSEVPGSVRRMSRGVGDADGVDRTTRAVPTRTRAACPSRSPGVSKRDSDSRDCTGGLRALLKSPRVATRSDRSTSDGSHGAGMAELADAGPSGPGFGRPGSNPGASPARRSAFHTPSGEAARKRSVLVVDPCQGGYAAGGRDRKRLAIPGGGIVGDDGDSASPPNRCMRALRAGVDLGQRKAGFAVLPGFRVDVSTERVAAAWTDTQGTPIGLEPTAMREVHRSVTAARLGAVEERIAGEHDLARHALRETNPTQAAGIGNDDRGGVAAPGFPRGMPTTPARTRDHRPQAVLTAEEKTVGPSGLGRPRGDALRADVHEEPTPGRCPWSPLPRWTASLHVSTERELVAFRR